MFKKIGSSPDVELETLSEDRITADPEIVSKFNKVAKNLKVLAPKSDDFLYFSIIFLKAAESAILDDSGKIKKLANGEDAWGFFDENWRWHGNVKPHKNNNGDIFPESELKIATAKWVGMPLCRDHESSSVDGIRGIIIDTHYDEKFKQVVGLCALDKVNYPDLARKVVSGTVRYGSMGTAVETSICSECGNKARTQNEYCKHVITRTAHGEINVGLKPIEYSLVVQPAEPGAVLLRCIASLKTYRDEFISTGVEDVDHMLGKLSAQQAQHLDGIMKTACGDEGCSIPQRRRIVRSFLENNGLVKKADLEDATKAATTGGNLLNMLQALNNKDLSDKDRKTLASLVSKITDEVQVSRSQVSQSPTLTSTETTVGGGLSGLEHPFSSAHHGGIGTLSGVPADVQSGESDAQEPDSFGNPIDPLNPQPTTSEEIRTTFAASKQRMMDTNLNHNSLNNLVEDIMNEANLKKRAQLRRRIAYMQGGAEGAAEPKTFKSETFSFDHDKQMHQDKSMGGDAGMFPGDEQVKEKLSRAELNERRIRRQAYMQGGAEGEREPKTFKSEPFSFDHDKQMHQDKSMGGDDGLFPGDAEMKEKLSRAEEAKRGLHKQAYTGPALSTRFTVKKTSDGRISKSASTFEVFSGDKLVIKATAGEIFGKELNDNWDWIRSREYGQEVCREIRASGLNTVKGLLKSAQAAPPELPDMGAPAPEVAPALPAPAAPEAEKGAEGPEEKDPAAEIDDRITTMEGLLSEVRSLVDDLKDQRMADVDVNVFTGKGKEKEETEVGGLEALSSRVYHDLKVAFAKLDNSADELSMVAETFDNISRLSSAQRVEFKKLAAEAVREADTLVGEATSLVRVASLVKQAMHDGHSDESWDDLDDDMEDGMLEGAAEADLLDSNADDDVSDLVAEAMDLRRQRREVLLKEARRAEREAILAAVEKTAAKKKAPVVEEEEEEEDETPKAKAKKPAAKPAAKPAMKKKAGEHDPMHDPMGVAMGIGYAEDCVDCDADDDAMAHHADEGDDAMVHHADEGDDAMVHHADEGDDAMVHHADEGDDAMTHAHSADDVADSLKHKMAAKKAEEEREAFRIKLRRAYDIGLEMQRKGLLPRVKTALDRQVDDIMSFDDKAFEAFKRSIANANPVGNVKVASDLGGINVGVETDAPATSAGLVSANTLSKMWD